MDNMKVISFPVMKVIQSNQYTYYEGYDENKKLVRYISVKHNKNGDNGLMYQFTLTNGKIEYVEGPWLDYSRDWI